MHAVRIIAAGTSAVVRTGRISATVIPIMAISARPINGCRGGVGNFMPSQFSLIGPLERKPQSCYELSATIEV